jgi:hypothetical protein
MEPCPEGEGLLLIIDYLYIDSNKNCAASIDHPRPPFKF